MKKEILFILTGILGCFCTVAQVNLYNKGILYISSSSDALFINGDFTNTSTAALTNNGKFYIKQNILNDQSLMAAGTGTLFLNGSSAQSLNGSQTFKTYNLTTDNSAGVTLNNDLSVGGTHTYAAGLITTSLTPNYLVYESGSAYLGDNDSRHVNGWVKKIGSTDFIFPVGNSSYERPSAIKSLSVSSEFDCHYYPATGNIYNLFSPLVSIDAMEYWQLNKISGGNATVALNWDYNKILFPNVLVNDIVAAYYNGINWVSVGGTASGNVFSTGNVPASSSVSSFGKFTFGFKSFPVPLKLIGFNVARARGISSVQWITENEQDVDHFEIQKSFDGVSFVTLANIPARNSNSREYYNYDDNTILNGTNYYRMKSVDIDRKETYSRTVAIYENDIPSFTVLNPVRNNLFILGNYNKEIIFNIKLFNASGQLALKRSVVVPAHGSITVPVTELPAGIYWLEISNEKDIHKQQIVVQK
jgi:hypothetical protein